MQNLKIGDLNIPLKKIQAYEIDFDKSELTLFLDRELNINSTEFAVTHFENETEVKAILNKGSMNAIADYLAVNDIEPKHRVVFMA